jgi:hypothetical protein
MFGYAAPAAPFGGKAWQEVQKVRVNGDPAVWHTVQSGAAEIGEVPVTAWQFEQSEAKEVGVDSVCLGARKGTAWFAPPGPSPWHSVLLKHPGAVPAGAGVDGGCGGFVLAPLAWQLTQTTAFTGSVFVCVLSVPVARQGLRGCGELTPLPWQPAVFRQETPEPPPAKSFP